MRLGGDCRMPHRMGGGTSDSENIYAAMKVARGTAYSQDDSADVNKELRAMSHSIAHAQAYQARGAWQSYAEEASTTLTEWEKVFGITPDPSENIADRVAMLVAIEQGNANPSETNIVAALSTALGETVSIVVERVSIKTKADPFPSNATAPTLTAVASAGTLRAGTHTVGCSFHSGDTCLGLTNTTTVAVTSGGAIRVGQVPLITGATRVDYYLSVDTNSTSIAYVGSGNGTAITLANYPTNIANGAARHLAIVVSPSTWANPVKRAKVHAILGPMLRASTTFQIVTSSPFLLGVSPLGRGAF